MLYIKKKSKIKEKKKRKHAYDQENNVRNHDLDHTINQEKKNLTSSFLSFINSRLGSLYAF